MPRLVRRAEAKGGKRILPHPIVCGVQIVSLLADKFLVIGYGSIDIVDQTFVEDRVVSLRLHIRQKGCLRGIHVFFSGGFWIVVCCHDGPLKPKRAQFGGVCC